MKERSVAVWNEKEACWIVTVEAHWPSGGKDVSVFEVVACDEFIIPMAEIEAAGYDSVAILDPDGVSNWSIKRLA